MAAQNGVAWADDQAPQAGQVGPGGGDGAAEVVALQPAAKVQAIKGDVSSAQASCIGQREGAEVFVLQPIVEGGVGQLKREAHQGCWGRGRGGGMTACGRHRHRAHFSLRQVHTPAAQSKCAIQMSGCVQAMSICKKQSTKQREQEQPSQCVGHRKGAAGAPGRRQRACRPAGCDQRSYMSS